jgi:serine/threonine protein kinase
MKIRDPREDDEHPVAAAVRLIDPNYDYFIPLSGDSCQIDLSSDEVQDCEAAANNNFVRGFFCKYGGQTLFDFLGKNNIHITQAWAWLQYLFQGLKLLHAAHIFHADIKNNNIVLHNNNPKLIDFGISFIEFPKDKKFGCSYRPAFFNALSPDPLAKMYHYYTKYYKMFGYVRGKVESDPLLRFWQQQQTNPSLYKSSVLLPNMEKLDIYQVIHMFFKDILKPMKRMFAAQNDTLYSAFQNLVIHNLDPDVRKCWTLDQNIKFMQTIPKTITNTKNNKKKP